MDHLTDLQPWVAERTWKVLQRADKRCADIISLVNSYLDECMEEFSIDPDTVCFVAVGSIGRGEALEASDLDLSPVLKSQKAYEIYKPHDKKIRELIQEKAGIKVSEGEDLTSPTTIEQLTADEAIGGDLDNSSALTKRILILSEGVSAGGNFKLEEIRREILNAYAAGERTRGRHVLTLCNDVARYYRTLAIEYKAKVDNHAKDWCTRNLKLRHSRKLWYFGIILTAASLSKNHPHGQEAYIEGLLEAFDKPTYARILDAVGDEQRIAVAHLLERFTWFLEFMSKDEHRDHLSKVKHEARYTVAISNPFPAMKMNSDLMHNEMIRIIDGLDNHVRRKVLDWFLF